VVPLTNSQDIANILSIFYIEANRYPVQYDSTDGTILFKVTKLDILIRVFEKSKRGLLYLNSEKAHKAGKLYT
jgi:hypothetical protein